MFKVGDIVYYKAFLKLGVITRVCDPDEYQGPRIRNRKRLFIYKLLVSNEEIEYSIFENSLDKYRFGTDKDIIEEIEYHLSVYKLGNIIVHFDEKNDSIFFNNEYDEGFIITSKEFRQISEYINL